MVFSFTKKGDVTVNGDNVTQVPFKNFATFIKCITKIAGTTVDDAKHLDLVMPMCSLIKYCSNFPETTRRLWFYLKDKANNCAVGLDNNNNFEVFGLKLNY